jgi:hypothetical protein
VEDPHSDRRRHRQPPTLSFRLPAQFVRDS